MRIGFIGAGKAGFSLGKYFSEKKIGVAGYYSKNPESAKEASLFTNSKLFDKIDKLVKECDCIFLSVPDGAIEEVWRQIKTFPIEGKLICHLSGAATSEVFTGIRDRGGYGYSVHPFLAISDKYTSYKDIGDALFTIEGAQERIGDIRSLLESCGNFVQEIDASQKGRYHMAASIASNFMVTLYDVAQKELLKCGFTEDNLPHALPALVGKNIESVMAKGPACALTGPIERGDAVTVRKHLDLADPKLKQLYVALASRTLALAKEKNPDRDYTELENILKTEAFLK